MIILSYDTGFVEKRGCYSIPCIPQLHPDLWPLFTGLSFWGNIWENLMVPYLMALFQTLVFCHHAGGWRLSLELTTYRNMRFSWAAPMLLAHIWSMPIIHLRAILVFTKRLLTHPHEGTARIWETKTGDCLRTLSVRAGDVLVVRGGQLHEP